MQKVSRMEGAVSVGPVGHGIVPPEDLESQHLLRLCPGLQAL